MHYYIYPRGKIGKTLGKMFDFLEMSDSYSFIDDYQEGITLKEQASSIKENIKKGGAKVVIALSLGISITEQRAKKLKNNLESFEIYDYLDNDFIESMAIEVCQKAERMIAQSLFLGGGALIGIVLYGLGNEKHLGNVDYELMNRGAKVVYLDSSGDDIVSRKYKEGQAIVVPLPMDYFKHIYFLRYFFSTASTYTRNDRQIFFVLHHSFSAILEVYIENKIEYLKKVYQAKIDYLFETSRKMTKVIQYLSPNKPILLGGGYAAFDNEIDIDVFRNKDSLLIALHDKEEIEGIESSLEEILKVGIKLFIRYRYEWGKDFLSYLKGFEHFTNFTLLFNNEELNNVIYQSFAIVTSASSMAYTFPLKTLCPAILCFEDGGRAKTQINGESFFDKRLHLDVVTPKELGGFIAKLYCKVDNEYFRLWRDRILDYREKEVYHWRNSSSYIANKILEIIDSKEDME